MAKQLLGKTIAFEKEKQGREKSKSKETMGRSLSPQKFLGYSYISFELVKGISLFLHTQYLHLYLRFALHMD